MTFKGKVILDNNHEALIQLIKANGGGVEIDGNVGGGYVLSEEDMDFVSTPVSGADPYTLAASLLREGRLTTLDCYFEIQGTRRYVNIDLSDHEMFSLTILANRVALARSIHAVYQTEPRCGA